MKHRFALRALSLAAVLLLPACATAPPPAPAPLAAVALLPVWDPPGRSAVTGLFTFDAWVRAQRDGVYGVLAAALQARLEAQGIAVAPLATPGNYAPVTLREAADVVAAAGGDTPVLYVRVLKWEASHPTHPQFVDALAEATLLAGGSGKVLWTARGPDNPVITRGATSLDAGYRRAAEAVAEWLVGAWRPPTSAAG